MNMNMSLDTKYKIVVGLFTLIIFTIWSGSILPSSISYTVTMIVGAFLFFWVIILLRNEENLLSRKKLRLPIFTCVELVAICFLIASIRFHMLGYCAIFCALGIIFPVFFFCVNISGENKHFFLQALWDGILVSYAVFLFLSFLFTPITGDVYSAFLKNPNTLGSYLIVVFIATLYKLNYGICYGKRAYNIRYSLVLGSVILFSIVSLSRTTILPMVLIIIIDILVIIACKKSIEIGLKQFVCIIMLIIMGVIGVFFLHGKVSYLMQTKTVWGDFSGPIVKSLHLNESEENEVHSKQLLANFQRKSMKGLDGSERFTSGRVEIWKAYKKELNWSGHATEERHIVTEYYDYKTNAHNTYLQIAYSTGIQGGVVFLALMLLIAAYSLASLISIFKLRNYDIEILSVLNIIISFGLNSLVAVGYSPFTAPIVFVFWVVSIFFIRKDGSNCIK